MVFRRLRELEWETLYYDETFEKCSILFKVKSKIPDFERGKARILTTGIPLSILRIRI